MGEEKWLAHLYAVSAVQVVLSFTRREQLCKMNKKQVLQVMHLAGYHLIHYDTL